MTSQSKPQLYVLDEDAKVPRGPFSCQAGFADPRAAAKVLAAFGEDACKFTRYVPSPEPGEDEDTWLDLDLDGADVMLVIDVGEVTPDLLSWARVELGEPIVAQLEAIARQQAHPVPRGQCIGVEPCAHVSH